MRKELIQKCMTWPQKLGKEMEVYKLRRNHTKEVCKLGRVLRFCCRQSKIKKSKLNRKKVNNNRKKRFRFNKFRMTK
jgi:hypothetical protein